ncbi:AIR carboxylase family protein [Patescibacteria group bacterium]|nr:AIR carboxylase family protein [Patescibacteria group bacterium]
MKSPRRVMVIVGSDSDLPQCARGLKHLIEAKTAGLITTIKGKEIITASVHRHLLTVQRALLLRNELDVIIAGAGMAAHLPGMIDSILRYELEDYRLVIIGVAFSGKTKKANLAARLSISQVPGTQVVFEDGHGFYFGEEGFSRACKFAISENLPIIKKPDPRPTYSREFAEVIEMQKTQ